MQKKTLLLLVGHHLDADGDHVEWVKTLSVGIKKVTLIFVANFFQLVVWNKVFPMQSNNVLTWDRVVKVAALVEGFQMDFA